MGRFLRENGLTIFFGTIFLLALGGQAIAGHIAYNADQAEHHEAAISLGRYLTSSAFGNAVMENWQSEFLQFTLYITATVWLIQRGSPESKEPGKEGTESDRAQKIGGFAARGAPEPARAANWRTAIYGNSLLIVMGLIFILSLFAQSVTGWNVYNDDQLAHHSATVSWWTYVGTANFWEQALQNWQSEFLAVGSMAIFAVYLRQRGSPESKPVGAPHEATGTEG
jgi:Domain of unknown function (DUF6766)